MSSSPTVITTGAAGSGETVLRLEINDFVKDERYWALYVQALNLMMADDQKHTPSHFQVGGIHGLPYVQWDGAGGAKPIQPPTPATWDGYCVHGSVIFPTWHRPYTALYEQIIQGYASSIADTYTTPDKADWQQAAKSLRLPYWDWTLESTKGVPPDEVLTLTQVTITKPDGSTGPVTNPLVAYKFHPIEPTFQGNFKRWPTTLRCPNSSSPTAHSTPATVVRNVSVLWEQRNAAVINLLTNIDSWDEMSNHTQAINPSYSASLEAIHDTMHVNVGGRTSVYGHMSDPDYAAHDPIFFLHHANVDHLLWMWQVLHPDSWIEPSTAQDGGTWTIKAGAPIDSKTPLAPFWNSNSSFWNSDEVRKPDSLFFTYPILQGLDMNNPQQAREELLNRISKKFDVGAAFPHVSAGPAHAAVSALAHPQTILSSGRDYRDWRVHIQCVKYALGGSYSIFVFLGDFPENPEEWSASPSLVGIHDIFAREKPEHCANCSSRPDLIDEGVVYLGPALHRAHLNSLEPDVVVPYLTRNLHWRVMKAGQGELPRAQLESLKVSVVSIPLRVERLPRRVGEAQRHADVTRGRQGGADDLV